jgi:gas vesicle protein
MHFDRESSVPDSLSLERDEIMIGQDISEYSVQEEVRPEEQGPGAFLVEKSRMECTPISPSPLFIHIGDVETMPGAFSGLRTVAYHIGADELVIRDPADLVVVTGPFQRRMEISSLRSKVLRRMQAVRATPSVNEGYTKHQTIGQAISGGVAGSVLGSAASALAGSEILGSTRKRSNNQIKEMMEGKFNPLDSSEKVKTQLRNRADSIRESGDFEDKIKRTQKATEETNDAKRQSLIEDIKKYWDNHTD